MEMYSWNVFLILVSLYIKTHIFPLFLILHLKILQATSNLLFRIQNKD